MHCKTRHHKLLYRKRVNELCENLRARSDILARFVWGIFVFDLNRLMKTIVEI